jgi:ABC-type polysaccharide/polyol phosphate transport system ATPase subunit
MSLFSLLNPAKDYLLAGALKLWCNQTLKRYGHMTHIRIDSQNHRIDAELQLKGESSPVQVALKGYELSSEDGETFIAIGEIETSREWINQLISDLLPPDKKRFKVPGALKVLL